MRDVMLVTGPPCGGKSTYVDEHAGEGDLIVCLDLLARAAGSPFEHDHNPAHFDAARARWSELLDEVAADDDAHAWVIRCAPLPAERVEPCLGVVSRWEGCLIRAGSHHRGRVSSSGVASALGVISWRDRRT